MPFAIENFGCSAGCPYELLEVFASASRIFNSSLYCVHWIERFIWPFVALIVINKGHENIEAIAIGSP